ncbi:DUF427 domain-containing protein [Prauserella halophila]|uniref:DUF427 domain-containing protein n=2 Tax=Prauserella halophila TaxID=185641 RepID=A0ABP4HCG2_9PSEU|nr:Uncharacterized conserved protein, DUF427 family [Prauserella halophila]
MQRRYGGSTLKPAVDARTVTAMVAEEPRTEQSAKRVRAVLAGVVVADTIRPLLVWENPYYPAYYVPREDVRGDVLVPSGRTRASHLGDGQLSTVRAGGREAVDAAVEYPGDALGGHVRLDWPAMDHWFEEDEEVYTHARDPHTRIDVLPSSRHVRIDIDGEPVAESHSPWLLFETGLPVRYYLPKPHVRLDRLTRTDTVTHCPYKGAAEYWSVGEYPDIAWSYRNPLPESERIAGLICFADERVDVHVDGVLQQRPQTPWS